MKSIKPIGESLIIFPLETEHKADNSEIIIVNKQLAYGEVQAVSDEFADVYKVGDIVIYASGAGISQQYNKKSCLWINGLSPKQGGHVYGIELDKI